MGGTRYGFLVPLGLIIMVLISAGLSDRIRAESSCEPYTIIYVRGSGQKAGSPQAERDSLKSRLNRYGIKQSTFVELDDNLDPSHHARYPAVSVNGGIGGFYNGLQASVSRSQFGAYKNSVQSGSDLLLTYLESSNILACNTRLVLAGYSQGAQVIGEAVNRTRFSKFKSNLSYIALFGDPALDNRSLNAGGLFMKPTWFKGNATEIISSGITSPRSPYFSEDIASKVGSWCDMFDMICTGNWLLLYNEATNHTHSKYPEWAIPEAAREIAKALKRDLPNLGANFGCTEKPQDIVLTIDTTEAARRDYVFYGKYTDSDPGDNNLEKDGPKKTATALFSAGCDVRVAVVGFAGENDSAPRVIADFSSNPGEVAATIRSLYKEDGSPMRVPARVREGLLTAANVGWRNNARHSVLLVTNSMSTGWNSSLWYASDRIKDYQKQPLTQQVIAAAKSHGISIFTALMIHSALTPTQGSLTDEDELYRSFSVPTGGKRFTQGCYYYNWMCTNLTTARTYMGQRLDVSVADVTMKVGETRTITYDDRSQELIDRLINAKNSIASQWYTNCDNPSQLTGSGRHITLTPTKPASCTASIKVAANGGIGCAVCAETFDMLPSGIATFRVNILPANYVAPAAPVPVMDLQEMIFSDNRIIQWRDGGGSRGYVIKDGDGNVLGITTDNKLTVTGANPNDSLDYSVIAVNENGASEAMPSEAATKIRAVVPPPVTFNDPLPSTLGDQPATKPPEETTFQKPATVGQPVLEQKPALQQSSDVPTQQASPATVAAPASNPQSTQPHPAITSPPAVTGQPGTNDTPEVLGEHVQKPASVAKTAAPAVSPTTKSTHSLTVVIVVAGGGVVALWLLLVWRRKRRAKQEATTV